MKKSQSTDQMQELKNENNGIYFEMWQDGIERKNNVIMIPFILTGLGRRFRFSIESELLQKHY